MKTQTRLFSGGLLVAALLMLTTGCGTKYHSFKLTTQPPGAEVILDGKTQSNTPTTIAVPKDKRDHYLFVGKEGCEEVRKIFRHNDYPESLNLLLNCDLQPGVLGMGDEAGTGTEAEAGIADSGSEKEGDGTVSVDGDDGRPMNRERFINEDLYFAYDSAVLSGEAQKKLQLKARWLEANPRIAIIIEGHTDERGTGAYNLALGDRRAQRVLAYFRELGVKEDRMLTVSFGEERPVNPAANEQAWSRNRRVHTAIE